MRWLPALLFAALVACEAATEPSPELRIASGPRSGGATELRAVSLRYLQQDLQTCQQQSSCSVEILELDGLTRLEGYIVDSANRDIVLFGKSRAGARRLHLDDLAVAFRNIWLRYAETRGRTIYYSAPGVTIDPRPGTLLALQKIGASVNSPGVGSDGGVSTAWEKTCRQLQDVRVIGIPTDTHFGYVMFDADYRMKQIVDGSLDLGIAGLESIPDMMVAMVEKEMKKGIMPEVSLGGMTRFWFHPRENTFESTTNAVRILKSTVALLDEAQHVTRGGQSVAAGHVDPLSRRLSQSFTNLYAEIAAKEGVYEDLESLYRLVALARVMHDRHALDAAGLDLDYLLDVFDVAERRVDREVPGIPNVRELEYSGDDGRSRWTISLRIPSCGGVSMGIEMDQIAFRPASRDFRKLASAALNARPAPGRRTWSFGGVDAVANAPRATELRMAGGFRP